MMILLNDSFDLLDSFSIVSIKGLGILNEKS